MATNTWNVDEVLACACAVDRQQGFIRSGYGYTNQSGVEIKDNKTAIMLNLTEQSLVDIQD